MRTVTAPTLRADIFMSGDLSAAKQVCREHCLNVGLCVHIEPVDFIYTGGAEAGFKVGLINYPRFPTDEASLMATAETLGRLLVDRLFQHSCSIVGPTETRWLTRRPADADARTKQDSDA